MGLSLTYHHDLAHGGRAKLDDALRKVVWDPSLDSVVKDVCFSCIACQLGKVTAPALRPPVVKIMTTYPMELMAADLCDLPRTRRGIQLCLGSGGP